MLKKLLAALALFSGASALTAHAEAPAPETAAAPVEKGIASYYSRRFEGRRTASGETFRNEALIAAHPSHPFNTLVRVTNLAKGLSVIVRVADRGPAPSQRRRGAIIDLSRAAAERIKMIGAGRARVRVEVLEWGNH